MHYLDFFRSIRTFQQYSENILYNEFQRFTEMKHEMTDMRREDAGNRFCDKQEQEDLHQPLSCCKVSLYVSEFPL